MTITFVSTDLAYNVKPGARVFTLDYANMYIPTLSNLMIPLQSPEELLVQEYLSKIMNNPAAFLTFMEVVYSLYENTDVVIFVPLGSKMHADLLSRILYDRYGISVSNANTLEDLNYLIETDFSIKGLEILDNDKAVMSNLIRSNLACINMTEAQLTSELERDNTILYKVIEGVISILPRVEVPQTEARPLYTRL